MRPNDAPAILSAPATRARRTSAGVRLGAAVRHRPATPETRAAAEEVPWKRKLPPPGTADVLIPGAARATHRPRFDHGYSRPEGVVAATPITSGSAAGYDLSLEPSLPAAATTTTCRRTA